MADMGNDEFFLCTNDETTSAVLTNLCTNDGGNDEFFFLAMRLKCSDSATHQLVSTIRHTGTKDCKDIGNANNHDQYWRCILLSYTVCANGPPNISTFCGSHA